MKNQEVRTEIAKCGFKLWQVAEKLGITDSAFSRKLRHEFSDEYKARIRTVIDELVKECEA